MEAIAYFTAMQMLLRGVRRQDVIAPTQRSSVIVGGLLGALIGTKALVMLQHIDLVWQNPGQFGLLILQGKTIVGVLLGGVLGVELTKKMIGVTQSTGDAFVYPLIVGMAIGRVGCFLTGLSDRTYGTATSLWWGVDFGDGIPRHPTQLYEIVFLLVLLMVLKKREMKITDGDRFRLFMIAYLSFRFAIDFIKPDFHPIFGMSAIQLACLGGLAYYYQHIRRFLLDFRV
jgi:phosphatidylglycerol---prolipoprotein diacylglyceryl transferase